MKTVLVSINAKYIHTNNAVRLLKANSTFDVDILEYTIKDKLEDIVEELICKKPDVIGFSVYIWNINLFRKIIDMLPLGMSKLILGGPEVSYEPSTFLNNKKVDFIIKGEGEHCFEALLQALNSNSTVEHIPSISYKYNGKMYHNPVQEIKDLSTLTLPYFFEEDIPHIPNKISYIESSRGCPYKCSYCLSSLEKTVRFFPLDEVEKSILYLMEKGTKTVKFLDRTFNANKHTLDLLDFIIKHNNQKTVFQFEITGDVLDPKIIEHLNKNAPYGLFRFEIGIQSINYETNFLVDRFQNTEKLFENIKLIQEGNIIDLHVDLIAGLPLENKESFKHTFDEVFKLGTKELQLGFLKMLRGTKIRLEADKYDYIYQQEAPYEIIHNNVLSEEDIKEIHLVEHMLEIYHNKGYFGHNMLTFLLSLESSYEFFLQIGNHYVANNYNMHGYQIEDVYKRIFDILDDHTKYLLTIDYLNRSKIKPKIFFNVVKDKPLKNEILSNISKLEGISINNLYKHSVIVHFDNECTIAYYKENKCRLFKYTKRP